MNAHVIEYYEYAARMFAWCGNWHGVALAARIVAEEKGVQW
jgi:hypothetical protein